MLQLPLNVSVDILIDSFFFFLLNQFFHLSSLVMEFGMSDIFAYNITKPRSLCIAHLVRLYVVEFL